MTESNTTTTTFLDIINDVDSFKLNNTYYKFFSHDGVLLGYIAPSIAQYFPGLPITTKSFEINNVEQTIKIGSEFDTLEKRNEMFNKVALEWRDNITQLEHRLKKGWRNELYTVYNPTSIPYARIERAFSVLLGVVTYGTHINGYISEQNSSNGKLKMWIPRRAANKPTYPNMLDNMVGGGLGYPYGIWETVVKECYEEAGLSEDFVASHSKCTGVLSYLYGTADGRVQPEVEYVYDIEFENEHEVVPHPVDGEVSEFKLLDLDEILEKLRNKEFKPNCGLVIVDFLVRHGYITPESEPNYFEIVTRCHTKFEFPTR
ncbi:thiamine pyrophosphokinase [Spathaspora passalidarum NRRL Y-27907]|uniref:Thiamine pyrophosphokinase n=1 Tax=Spathaspora passalidarum (strain NRRL Y-27907 / 11-Y1) TaxID=619300 RepID=G3AL24_SPAPN|nr:thiamine pyrophosphokinase [Spathaspora passalidarum NRRL Y-27907]EGW33067.1 thiamine pyrophosphokinase [Spathaspora passalidarum NRRL Y-27907]